MKRGKLHMKNQLRSIVLLCAGGAILAWGVLHGKSLTDYFRNRGIVYLVVCGVLIARHVFCASPLTSPADLGHSVSGLILMVTKTASLFHLSPGKLGSARGVLVPGIIATASIVTHPHSPIRRELIQSSENPARFPKVLITLFSCFI